MKQLILTGTAAFAMGAFAATQWQSEGIVEPHAQAPVASQALVERVAALEERLTAAEELTDRLAAQLLEFAPGQEAGMPLQQGEDPVSTNAAAGSTETVSVRRRGRSRNPEERRAALIEEGFDTATADWIMKREAAMRMDAIRERYQARRDPNRSGFSSVFDAQREFREQLGDGAYEKYLKATGRPTRVMVSEVIPTSPAESAGLQPGDSIVSYGGGRVFNMGDLMRRTFEGVEGEPVLVEVDRQGVLTQFYLPRGPLGINGVGRRGR